jgi:hypothetical protein
VPHPSQRSLGWGVPGWATKSLAISTIADSHQALFVRYAESASRIAKGPKSSLEVLSESRQDSEFLGPVRKRPIVNGN